ncbi:Uncharacterised protein [Psychrobacter phenylpyruvicus]|uniref:Uncharacterized protein n=1 Tax=Psychrobacter phenylpyruvicus TaxID=29432 RepID=A0A379LQ30_9GAMM|nr:Uncharacterised protein [Psychrobacter phenylpyruvicus]
MPPSGVATKSGAAGPISSVLASLSPAITSEFEVPLSLLFSALTVEPSSTASGAIVTLPFRVYSNAWW